MTFKKMPGVKSVETKHMEERAELFRALKWLDRRSFMKVSAAAMGAVVANGIVSPHSFQPVSVALAQTTGKGKVDPFTFAYISDSHLYDKSVNDRFVNAIMRAVDDVNSMEPQPDFVFFGGDLAQLGQPQEIELGAQILKNVKAPMQHDGRRARLVLRHGREVATPLWHTDLFFRSQGGSLRRLEQRRREGLLDGAQAQPHGAHAHRGGGSTTACRVPSPSGTSNGAWLENDLKGSPGGHADHRVFSLAALTSSIVPGISGRTTPSRSRRS